MTVDKPMRSGFCECECGERTPIATETDRARGHYKGVPNRFVRYHGARRKGPRYVIEDRGYATPCHVWQLALSADGYGIDSDNLAHRVAYEAAKGPVLAGLELDHLCRVPACVNAEHLEAVTHAENMRRSVRAKLSVAQVHEIRRRHTGRRGERAALAAEFGVTPGAIWRIVTRRAWADV